MKHSLYANSCLSIGIILGLPLKLEKAFKIEPLRPEGKM
jgi:hypothetical protein